MSKQIISEVAILRPIIILLLVLMHSFAPYVGAWESIFENDGSLIWPLYRLLVKLISGFRIEAIVFIAGYIFAYQTIDLGRTSKFKDFILSKLKRLYLPCLFFGIIYYFCFYNQGSFDISNFILKVTSGCGHLWFLPVLFWCFIIGWFLNNYRINHFIALGVLAFISILPIPFIPLGISRSIHFYFYFYFGYLLWIYRNEIMKYAKVRYIFGLLLLYISSVICSEYFITDIFMSKYVLFALTSSVDFLMAIFGILFSYLLVCRYTYKPNFVLSPKVFYLSSVCYGIYIYHQFLLKYLYYYTSFPILIGEVLLPWVSFILVTLVSYVLTVLSLRTKVGRFLIG
jgi:hypothetical protein